jgi:hypothetical protein
MKKRFETRPLSYSQLASFEYSREDWFDNYVLGKRTPPTPEMLIGTKLGDLIGTDDNPIEGLNPPGQKEYPVEAELEGIRLVGFIDHFCPNMLVLHENKTSPNKKRWTQRKADEHHQLTMYALMLNMRDGIEPEDIEMWLNFIPVELVGVTYKPTTWRAFETRRTKQHLEAYKQYIMRTVEAMDEYIRVRSTQHERRKAPVYNG